MAASTPSSGLASVGLLLARLPVGIVLALTGYSNFRMGVGNFVDQWQTTAEQFMPANMAGYTLHALPYVEMALGALLVIGLFTRLSALGSALLLLALGWARGGMSGLINANPESASQLFTLPMLFGVMALVGLFAGPGKVSLDAILFGRRGGK